MSMTPANDTDEPPNRTPSPKAVFHDLTGFQRDVLTVLASLDAPSGAEIYDPLTDYYTDTLEPSRLYPALDKLSDKGLITVSEKDARTNTYELTHHGNRVLAAGRSFHDDMLSGATL